MSKRFSDFYVMRDTPGIWVLNARRLKRCGDLIFDAYVSDLLLMEKGTSPLELNNLETAGGATLLFGLSIENLVKAIIIKNNPKTNNGDMSLNWVGDGHELNQMIHQIGFILNTVEKDLINRLETYVKWAGRYRIPKKPIHMYIKQANIRGKSYPLPLQMCERAIFEQLYERLEQISLNN